MTSLNGLIRRTPKILIGLIGFFLLSILILLNACQVESLSEQDIMKQGAGLWATNCVRCHNIPSPTDFSDENWDVIVNGHMRVRANLTGKEARIITTFLKNSN